MEKQPNSMYDFSWTSMFFGPKPHCQGNCGQAKNLR